MNMTAIAEGARARIWRESFGMSRLELSELVGWSPSAIATFERGFYTKDGVRRPVQHYDMLSYRLACAAIAYRLEFDWQPPMGYVDPGFMP